MKSEWKLRIHISQDDNNYLLTNVLLDRSCDLSRTKTVSSHRLFRQIKYTIPTRTIKIFCEITATIIKYCIITVVSKMEQKHLYDYLLKVQSIAKIGLTYSTDPYAIANYHQINDLTREMLEKLLNVSLERNNYFERDIYPTPNVSVRTILFSEKQEVLLVRESRDGAYSLPGGWCDLYDSPSEAAKQECLQEAGADVMIERLVGVFNRTPFKAAISVPEYMIVFVGKVIGPLKPHEHETTEVGYFPMHQLPELSRKVSKDEYVRVIEAALKGDVLFD